MANIAQQVHRFIDQDSSIRKDLGRGIINTRALATHIQRQLGSSNINAIISAIRRYETSDPDATQYSDALKLIREAKISTKNHICNIALIKDASVQQQLPKLFSLIRYDQGEVLRVIQAEESIKVIVDQKNAAAVIGLFPPSKVVLVEENLAEITMNLDPMSAKVKGVLAILNTELANSGVNILETMSCVPELVWFIDEKDLLRAHQAFLNLS